MTQCLVFHYLRWSENTGGSGCEAEDGGDEDDNWYLGTVPCFTANVAFTLYGKLKGKRGGCSKGTYINSFYTFEGVEAFTNALARAATSGFSYVNVGDGEGEGENNGNNGGDYGDMQSSACSAYYGDDGGNRAEAYDDVYVNNAESFNYDASSQSLSCSSDGSFDIKAFGGGSCFGGAATKVIDNLRNFNKLMKNSGCVEIYDSSSSQQGKYSPLYLLQQSKTCSLRDTFNKCPDPHGKLARYTKRLEGATSSIDPHSIDRARTKAIARTCMIWGVAFILLAFLFLFESCSYGSDGKSKISKMIKARKRSKSRKRKTKKKKQQSTKPRVAHDPEPDYLSDSTLDDSTYGNPASTRTSRRMTGTVENDGLLVATEHRSTSKQMHNKKLAAAFKTPKGRSRTPSKRPGSRSGSPSKSVASQPDPDVTLVRPLDPTLDDQPEASEYAEYVEMEDDVVAAPVESSYQNDKSPSPAAKKKKRGLVGRMFKK